MQSMHGLNLQETDQLEFTTDGVYSHDDSVSTLSYDESEVTGLPGTVTTVSVYDDRIVVDRTGGINSRMIFKEGCRESFLYSTPFGDATMGVDTRKIRHTFGDRGGQVEVDYIVNLEHVVAMRNKFFIDVSEPGGKQ